LLEDLGPEMRFRFIHFTICQVTVSVQFFQSFVGLSELEKAAGLSEMGLEKNGVGLFIDMRSSGLR